MEKQQLLDYLKAAMDLESAKYTCEMALAEVDRVLAEDCPTLYVPEVHYAPKPTPQQIEMSSKPMMPREPRKPALMWDATPLPKKHDIGILGLVKKFIDITLVMAIGANTVSVMMYKQTGNVLFPNAGIGAKIVACVSLAITLTGLGISRWRWHQKVEMVKQQNQEKQLAAQLRYDKELQEYQKKQQEYQQAMATYAAECERRKQIAAQLWEADKHEKDEKHLALLKSAEEVRTSFEHRRKFLRDEHQRLHSKRSDLSVQLLILYDQNVLYPTYRNYVAVAQIYDYIASGISNQLEGPDGAYAQYQNDIRTAKVCNSIEQLRQDMRKGITAILEMQYSICNELERCESAIWDVERGIREIDDDMNSFRDEFEIAASNLDEKIDIFSSSVATIQKHAAAYEEKLDSIRSGIADVASSSSETAYNTAMIGLNQYIDMKTRGVDGYYANYVD